MGLASSQHPSGWVRGAPKAPTSYFTARVLFVITPTSWAHVTIPQVIPKFCLLLVADTGAGEAGDGEVGLWSGTRSLPETLPSKPLTHPRSAVQHPLCSLPPGPCLWASLPAQPWRPGSCPPQTALTWLQSKCSSGPIPEGDPTCPSTSHVTSPPSSGAAAALGQSWGGQEARGSLLAFALTDHVGCTAPSRAPPSGLLCYYTRQYAGLLTTGPDPGGQFPSCLPALCSTPLLLGEVTPPGPSEMSPLLDNCKAVSVLRKPLHPPPTPSGALQGGNVPLWGHTLAAAGAHDDWLAEAGVAM